MTTCTPGSPSPTSGRVGAALCHGVALLRHTQLFNEEPLVARKAVTGFANEDVAVSPSGKFAGDHQR
jgi:hypothetical protein